jgi:hypothetical protein
VQGRRLQVGSGPTGPWSGSDSEVDEPAGDFRIVVEVVAGADPVVAVRNRHPDPAPEQPAYQKDRRQLLALGDLLHLCRYTASVTSSGGQLCPRVRLPSRVVQLHLVALLVTIPSTGWRGDATQLLERAGVVIGQRCSAIAARRSGPCLPSPR